MITDLDSVLEDARRALIRRDFQQALTLLNRAGAIAIEDKVGEVVIAHILRAIGDARCGLEDWEGAEAHYREALARMETLDLMESSDAAGLLCNLGYLLDKQGRFDESDAVYHRALATRSRLLGKDHPDMVPILNNMAYRFMSLGDLKRAQALLERALLLVQAHVESDSLTLVEPLNNLGELYRRLGMSQRAVEMISRALRILEPKLPFEDHPDLLVLLRNAASALRDDGREAEAKPLEDRANRIANG